MSIIDRLTLKQWRDLKDLSLETVSDQLGVSIQTLFAWETGKSLPRIDHAYKLAEIYNTHPDNIIFFKF